MTMKCDAAFTATRLQKVLQGDGLTLSLTSRVQLHRGRQRPAETQSAHHGTHRVQIGPCSIGDRPLGSRGGHIPPPTQSAAGARPSTLRPTPILAPWAGACPALKSFGQTLSDQDRSHISPVHGQLATEPPMIASRRPLRSRVAGTGNATKIGLTAGKKLLQPVRCSCG